MPILRSGRGNQFVLDTTEVLGGMRMLDKVMFLKVRTGLKLAGLKFMTDTVVGLPSIPIRRPTAKEPVPYDGKRIPGGLRGSGATFVGRTKVGKTTPEYGIPLYQATVYGGTPITPMNPQACVVFNAPYTFKQHEVFALKTEPTAGMYFLSEKLNRNGVQYMAIIAKAIRL